jgi:long-subunit fatty acid transport protein
MLAGVIDNSQNAVVELVAGASYRVNERLSIGGSARLGYGLFRVMTTARPSDSQVQASGVGIGAALGAMWRASPRATLAASWRSGLSVQTTGDGAIGADVSLPVEFTQRWPQSASVGVAILATPDVTVATQLDWTQWSRLEQLDVIFPTTTFVQTYPLDWDDTYGARLGVEWRRRLSSRRRLALRAGGYFDTNAIPDYTIERQYIDREKFGLSYGASFGVGAWRVDFGGDLLGVVGGSPRTVPDNSADVGGFGALRNVSPGEYSSKLLTFELAVVRRL